MTDYEKASLRLALLAATQRQALIALTAKGLRSAEGNVLANEGEAMLNKAVNSVGKLL